MIIGSHISISGGYRKAVEASLSIGANTFQCFSRNPRGGAASALDDNDIKQAEVLMELNKMGPILIHAPYTLNMAAAKDDSYQFARECFVDDMKRMIQIPTHLYVFHPGSRTTLSYETAIERIAETLKIGMIEGSDTKVLLETMSGKGSEIGKTFEELKDIIDAVGDFHGKDNIGVCLDTCHVYCAGYDIVNNLDGVLDEFDKIIGIDKIKAVHLNDTMNPFNSHKDRHAKIGEGDIGLDAVIRVVTNERLKDKPFYLETPHDDIQGYGEEIKLIREKALQ